MFWFLLIVLLLIIAPMFVVVVIALAGGILLLFAIFFGAWIGTVYLLMTHYPELNPFLDIVIGFVAGIIAARLAFLWAVDNAE